MNIKQEILKILARHLSLEAHRVFLFGSRASGRAKKWSDFDIGIEGKSSIPLKTLTQIEVDLEESDIPYIVQVVDFNRVSDKFKNFALNNIQLWTTN